MTSLDVPLTASQPGEDLTVALYASTGGAAPVPTGNPLETTSVKVTSGGGFGPPPVIETASFAGTTVLQKGIPYYMVLSEGTTGGLWYLNDQNQLGRGKTQDGGNTWSYLDTLESPAFRVNGTLVPEASTYLLFGLGTLGIIAWQRRKGR